MASLKFKIQKNQKKLIFTNAGNVNRKAKLNMKIVILIGIILLLSSCGKFELGDWDPTTTAAKWLLTHERK